MEVFTARGELLTAALRAAADHFKEETGDPNADAESEYLDDILTEKVTQYTRILLEVGKIELDGYLPAELEQSIRNQIIGFLRGKVAARRDELPNIGDLDERTAMGREIAAFDAVIVSLEQND